MRIEAKFTYIAIAIDSRRKIHLEAAKSNLNRSIDAVSVVFRGLRGVFTKPSRVYGLILKVKLSSRLMLLLHARLFAPPLNSNSSISYRISGETFRQCGLSTGASFNRYDRIDSRKVGNGGGKEENRSATLYATEDLIDVTKMATPVTFIKGINPYDIKATRNEAVKVLMAAAWRPNNPRQHHLPVSHTKLPATAVETEKTNHPPMCLSTTDAICRRRAP